MRHSLCTTLWIMWIVCKIGPDCAPLYKKLNSLWPVFPKKVEKAGQARILCK